MVISGRRSSALLLTLALSAGNIGLCAGWTAAAEARMACCSDGPGCPMSVSNSDDSHSRHGVTQEQADACCAVSEGGASGQSNPSFVVTINLAVVRTANASPHAVTDLVLRDAWRLAVPVSPASVPKHVLHSVFLV
jgi:hypothetical protein